MPEPIEWTEPVETPAPKPEALDDAGKSLAH
jgi:ATP-dependent Lon protease